MKHNKDYNRRFNDGYIQLSTVVITKSCNNSKYYIFLDVFMYKEAFEFLPDRLKELVIVALCLFPVCVLSIYYSNPNFDKLPLVILFSITFVTVMAYMLICIVLMALSLFLSKSKPNSKTVTFNLFFITQSSTILSLLGCYFTNNLSISSFVLFSIALTIVSFTTYSIKLKKTF